MDINTENLSRVGLHGVGEDLVVSWLTEGRRRTDTGSRRGRSYRCTIHGHQVEELVVPRFGELGGFPSSTLTSSRTRHGELGYRGNTTRRHQGHGDGNKGNSTGNSFGTESGNTGNVGNRLRSRAHTHARSRSQQQHQQFTDELEATGARRSTAAGPRAGRPAGGAGGGALGRPGRRGGGGARELAGPGQQEVGR